ncbi:MAG: YbgA family protein [Nitrospinaceae bacterium]
MSPSSSLNSFNSSGHYSGSIKLGVSACLLGERVRWDGNHKRNRYLTDVLSRYFSWVTVCPEVEAGMGAPREPVHLMKDNGVRRLVAEESGKDWTSPMARLTRQRISELKAEGISGFIFKSKSPSCGLVRIPVILPPAAGEGRHIIRREAGLFAARFQDGCPLIPVTDEERISDPATRDNFLGRVLAHHRLQTLWTGRFSFKALVRFHTEHQFLVLAHSRKHLAALDRLVSLRKPGRASAIRDRYGRLFMEAFNLKATVHKHTAVLRRMTGFLQGKLSPLERQDLREAVEAYYLGQAPRAVALTLIRRLARKFEVENLSCQVYLNPHPIEWMVCGRI